MGDWGANDWSKRGGNDWDSSAKKSTNDWGKKEESTNDWGKKEESTNDWGKKEESTNDWDKKAEPTKEWDQGAAGDSWAKDAKKDDTTNDWGKEESNKDWGGNDWATDEVFVPPVDPTFACFKNSNKEWTREMWESAEKKKETDKKDFYDFQQYNVEGQITSQKTGWELDQDEETLFGSRSGANAGIDFAKYEHIPVEVSGNKAENIPVAKTFEELFEQFDSLPQSLKDNVRRCKYTTPTPVQKYAIPAALSGRDVMCCAQTGSGKTASFLIPIVGRMISTHHNPIGGMTVPFEGECDPDTMVLSPTRELCVQIYEEACKFTHRTPYRVVRIYGGEKPGEQIKEISKGADVLIATPGRLIDFLNRGLIRLDRCAHLVLDEADRMLDMGFEPQVRQLVDSYGMPTKNKRQTMMFSATFAKEVQELAKAFLYDYLWVGVGRVGGAVESVTQELLEVTPEEKPDKLVELLDNFLDTRADGEVGIIFCNSKASCTFLDEYLWEKKVDVAALHGDLNQQQRDESMRKFRLSLVDVLVATDVASRGLDVEKVRLVINYDLPTEVDAYIHRIGRTGRIGNRGKAISFIARSAQDDNPLENLTVLKELVNILHYTANDVTNNKVPDWLQPLIDRGENINKGGVSWGGRDARNGNYGSYEEREKPAAAGSQEWAAWNNDGGAASDPWKNKDASADEWKKTDASADEWKKQDASADEWKKYDEEAAPEAEETAVEITADNSNDWWNSSKGWGEANANTEQKGNAADGGERKPVELEKEETVNNDWATSTNWDNNKWN
eukprot:GEMP01007597.1.p1 GENE.GEMP01007597.1~~GEMP01007597.1.p1  ORF type:complete len:797 (+),score=186.43 GEMP01007597.1:33-2393(+)